MVYLFLFQHYHYSVVKDIGFVKRLKEIKETLEEIMGEYEEMEEDEGKYIIFDMDEYHVGDYILGENRNWIYEYEVNEYYELVKKRLYEYRVLMLEID